MIFKYKKGEIFGTKFQGDEGKFSMSKITPNIEGNAKIEQHHKSQTLNLSSGCSYQTFGGHNSTKLIQIGHRTFSLTIKHVFFLRSIFVTSGQIIK